jgi:hypothetical protein
MFDGDTRGLAPFETWVPTVWGGHSRPWPFILQLSLFRKHRAEGPKVTSQHALVLSMTTLPSP